MSWRFVGRAEQLGQLGRALQNPAAGPIVLAGEQGMGRTTLITRALDAVNPKHTRIVWVRPAGSAPLSALQASLPGSSMDPQVEHYHHIHFTIFLPCLGSRLLALHYRA